MLNADFIYDSITDEIDKLEIDGGEVRSVDLSTDLYVAIKNEYINESGVLSPIGIPVFELRDAQRTVFFNIEKTISYEFKAQWTMEAR